MEEVSTYIRFVIFWAPWVPAASFTQHVTVCDARFAGACADQHCSTDAIIAGWTHKGEA